MLFHYISSQRSAALPVILLRRENIHAAIALQLSQPLIPDISSLAWILYPAVSLRRRYLPTPETVDAVA